MKKISLFLLLLSGCSWKNYRCPEGNKDPKCCYVMSSELICEGQGQYANY